MRVKTSISTQILTNPFSVYGISFVAVLACFALRWSSFYPKLGGNLLTFILITSGISLLAARLIRRKNVFRPIPKDKNNARIFTFIILGNIAEYIYCKSIPFVSVVLGGLGNYLDFEGIPTFHVLLVGISLFFGVYVFHQYQSNPKDKVLLRYVFLSYLPFILGLNRGAIVLILFSSTFIYLMRIKRIPVKKIVMGIIGFLAFVFLFGMVGNLRNVSSQENKNYILQVGGATDEFIDSGIPAEFYWGYIYIASPMGNLQNAIDAAKPEFTFQGLLTIAIQQCTPNFVSKRLSPMFPVKEYDHEEYLVTTTLNAPSVYYAPYILSGWTGVIFMFVFMIITVFFYFLVVPIDSAYFITGWSFLITVIVLNTFNNMWIFNGLYLITIPILLTYLKRVRIQQNHHG